MDNLISQNDLNAVDELDESNVDERIAKDNELIFEASPSSLKSKSLSTSKLNSFKASFFHSNLTENSSPNFLSASNELASRKETATVHEITTTIETERVNLSEI
jgi:hypothetical protein